MRGSVRAKDRGASKAGVLPVHCIICHAASKWSHTDLSLVPGHQKVLCIDALGHVFETMNLLQV